MANRIEKAAVIGSGIMGGGIAALIAGAGIEVLLLDIVPPNLSEEEKNDPAKRNMFANNGLTNALMAQPPLFYSKKDATLISTGNLDDDFDRLSECDWICEVVVENLKIKQSLFEKIEKIRKKDSIITSNTSGLPLSKISEGRSLDFKKHFMGTHFFNPVRWMHLLELIPGKDTDPEILSFMAKFGEINLGKGIVWAKDTPNFIANRIGIQSIAKIMHELVNDNMKISEVDALFGPAVGRPSTAVFGTSDLVGLDTMAHVLATTYDMVPEDEERDLHILPDFVQKMLKDGKLGDKTKQGFYKKERIDGKKIKFEIDPATGEYIQFEKASFPCIDASKKAESMADKVKAIIYGDDKGARFAWKCSANGLIYAANRIPEIAVNIVEIDNAMKWGYALEAGPFETWDAIGVRESVNKMKKDGFAVPENIEIMLDQGFETFYKTENGHLFYYDFQSTSYKEVKRNPYAISISLLKGENKTVKTCSSVSLIDIGDDVFCVEFHTKMNALNREIIEFMYEASDFVLKNGAGIVIGNQAGGMPGAFSAGADLDYVLGLCKDKKYSEIDDFLKLAQQAIMQARYSSIPVVAAPYGMTLGGGCEICLGAADKIVSAPDLMMGLVEIGVGLLPAGGGCLNLWKKFLSSLPGKIMKDIDLAKLFIPVFQNIATAQYSMSAKGAMANGHMSLLTDRIVMNKDNLIGEAKKDVLYMVENGYTKPVKEPVKVMGREGQGIINAEINNMYLGGFVTEYETMLAKRIAFVISGGEVKGGTMVDEDIILKLERDAFIDFTKEQKTVERIEHMLTKNKPLRN